MGEVYRARDGKLNRDVALKILPEAFATDPDRLARFRREAQVLASLSHPNIGHIYGFEDSGATHALVLELIEGPTLADRIAHGPIPLSEALPIVRQIAGALETAHEQGIIHRDLKPANIKVKDDGTVKVLDFGLAKALAAEPASAAADAMNSPTLTSPAVMTRRGVILGTAAYMSPEQARGKVVDKRTDIWAFGCVLFEMLTGRLAFKGDTVSDTIVAILSGEPEWGALPAETPASVRGLLQRCLEKDPKLRLRDLGDARIELDQLDRKSGPVEAAPQGTRPTPRARPWWARSAAAGLVAVGLLVLAGAAGVFYATRPRVPVTTPSEYTQITNFADSAVAPSLSPDGRMLTFKRGGDAFLSSGEIYVKTLPNGEPIRLTNDADSKYAPVFTPDGSRITYTTHLILSGAVSFDTWTVRVSGGQPPTQLLPNASGLSWIPGQRLLFAEVTGPGPHMGIVTATESRAERRLIYSPSHHDGMAHYASLSPNGQSVLVVEMDQSHVFDRPCRLLPFDGSSAGGQVGPRGTCTSAAWSPDGKWMYFSVAVGGSSHIWRQTFPNGAPEQITFGPGEQEDVALGPDGTWLVTSVGTRRSAIWLHDATGERAILSEGYAVAPRLSRSGTRVFYLSARDLMLSPLGWAASSAELRVLDIASGNPDSVLPAMSVTDYDISSDEKEVAFTRHERDEGPEIWLAPLDRRTPPRRIAERGDRVSFAADGYLVFRSLEEDTKLVRIKKEGGVREPVTTVPILDKFGVSPDGQWAIVVSSGAGADTVHGTVAVSLRRGAPRKICEAGCAARWSSDGRFFYVRLEQGSTSAQGRTIAIPVPAGQSLPYLPASGIGTFADAMKLAGARVIDRENVFPGLTPTMYLFQKTELQRNLFRIPLH
jgi:eukaryotic-like serine/threonine-protein kinase